MNLCIFTPAGRTYTFRNVQLVQNNETMMTYEYTSMSDGQRKILHVLKNNIVAYSLSSLEKDYQPDVLAQAKAERFRP